MGFPHFMPNMLSSLFENIRSPSFNPFQPPENVHARGEEEGESFPEPRSRRIVIINSDGNGGIVSSSFNGERFIHSHGPGPTVNLDEIFRRLLGGFDFANGNRHQQPASEDTIENLNEVMINENDCEYDKEKDEYTPPNCSI
mmetsp:Transcript_42820/g.50207  ORF Transcript_42820/g.50207 Transcript_42820/m.50207 type:complete len:142 (-) Transcript_42820:144-569(-)